MKKIALVIFLMIFTWQLPIVEAHILKTDGSIGAVLHIDPEDDPIAKEPSYFFFEFKDKENKFQPSACNCKITIFEAGKEIYHQPLSESNINSDSSNFSFTYIFPEKNIYTIEILGKPYLEGDFQPFNLKYLVRVANESPLTNQNLPTKKTWISSHLIILISGGIILLAGLILFLKRKKTGGTPLN